jgi:hypothetical protein
LGLDRGGHAKIKKLSIQNTKISSEIMPSNSNSIRVIYMIQQAILMTSVKKE